MDFKAMYTSMLITWTIYSLTSKIWVELKVKAHENNCSTDYEITVYKMY